MKALWLLALLSLAAGLVGCGPVAPATSAAAALSTAPALPPLPTAPPTAAPAPAPTTPEPATATPLIVPPTVAPTSTPVPPPPTATPLPPTATPLPAPTASPTAAVTPDPTLQAQEQYCDTASPPAHLPLPLDHPVQVPTPSAPTQPLPAGPGPQRISADDAPNVTAQHVAIVDEDSGALLYAKDPFARVAPASITKIVTSMVALERQPDIHHVYTTTVSASALVACDGSSVMGLEPGDHVQLETLLYGMLLPSGNDAAEQVAVLLGGTREQYVAWMNQKVASLGLTDTHFVNPSGMDADGHYSSAYDMAMLAREAMRNPVFRQIVSTQRQVEDDYYMHNLNALLGTYDGTDGVKIGYTDSADRTMVASVTRNGHRVYVSVMHSDNLVGDTTSLFDWVWRTFQWS